MNILSKIKYYFKPKAELPKEELYQVFQNHLKIRAELQASDIKLNGGINFKVNYRGSIVPFWLNYGSSLDEKVAEAKIQSALQVIAVGLALKLNLVEISQALKEEKMV